MSKKSREKAEQKKRLEAYYEDIRRKRAEIQRKNQPFLDRVRAIMDAPRYARVDFWCDICKRDCSGVGYKQICTIRERVPTAWYVGFCQKGHRLIRRITDKGSDPYYSQSLFLMRQRSEMEIDLLTPDDPRFKIFYPKQWAEMNKKHGTEQGDSKDS